MGQRSKDLWVFCYGIRATYETGGLKDCAKALSITNDYLDSSWDGLFPPAKRPARRSAPFTWLASKLEGLLPKHGMPGHSPEDYKFFKTELQRLDKTLKDKLADNAPSYTSIIKQIPVSDVRQPSSNSPSGAPTPNPATPTQSEQSVQAAPGQPQQPQQAATHTQPPQAFTPTESGGANLLNENDMARLYRNCQENAQQLAGQYLALAPTDPRAYLLHRTSLWCTIGKLPQASPEKVTPLRPLPRDRSDAYSAAVNSGQFASVLPQLEKSAGKAPFWFDGHHMVVRCLEGVGAADAAKVVRDLLVLFLKRFPGLEDYKFHDGTPFAADETQQWISGLKADAASAGRSMVGGGGGSPEDAEAEEKLKQALEAGKKDGFDAGLALLGPLSPSRSRSAVKGAVIRARYFIAMKKDQSGAALLMSTYKKLEEWGLLDWEPGLAAELLYLLLSSKAGRNLDEYPDLLNRLYWLQPDTALGFANES